MSEEIRDIPNFEGKYAITTTGKVWSYKHKKFLKPKLVGRYEHVDIFDKDKKMHQCLIHRLVAITFLPNPENLPCVNHIDECTTNNSVDNLEWCTYQQNMLHGTRSQRAMQTYGSMEKCHKASAEAHKRMVRCVETGKIYSSVSEAANDINYKSVSHISSCCTGRKKTAGGFHWEYVGERKKSKNHVCGIYGIHNIVTDEWYIGQSKNTASRISLHFHDLKYNKHTNKDLQDSYNKYGQEAFYTTVLEECNEGELNEMETFWIEAMGSVQKGFNRRFKDRVYKNSNFICKAVISHGKEMLCRS